MNGDERKTARKQTDRRVMEASNSVSFLRGFYKSSNTVHNKIGLVWEQNQLQLHVHQN